MTGRLAVVGLGPGDWRYLTPEAGAALAAADALYGYGRYLDRVPARAGQSRHASDNREERARAAAALRHAAQGVNVAVVSGGDPGVFAVSARIGAPLGHDFCAISLSDNLKPWELIERRLDAAAGAGFVIALYNPISRARPWQLRRAFERLGGLLPPSTPVVFGRAIGRTDEQVTVTTLAAADPNAADMATLLIVGSRETHVIERPGLPPLVYTSRSAQGTST